MTVDDVGLDGLVSIVMPTFNHGRYIGEAIDSIRAQTYSNWELIVVNNYSSDDTREIVEKYDDKRIRLIDFRNNGIIAASRNAGIECCRGQYIAMLDSDDVWSPPKLSRQVRAMQENPEICLVATNYTYFPTGEGLFHRIEHDMHVSGEDLARSNPIGNSSVLMRRTLVRAIGRFDESEHIVTIEDYDYWLRVMDRLPGAIMILKEPLMMYRTHPKNLSRLDDDMKVWKRHATVYSKFTHATFYPVLKKRSQRELTLIRYGQLVHRKISLATFMRDGRIPSLGRLARLGRFALSRLVKGVPS